MKKLLIYYLLSCFIVGCKQTDKQAGNKKADTSPDRITHCAPKTTDKDWYTMQSKAPKFTGLNGVNVAITTSNTEVSNYFNQGLMLAYGFNHAEAARSFYQAIRLDSTCAMCYWGYAYVLGPNYNAGMEEDNFERAYVAAQKAQSLSTKCTTKEKELIQALTSRYTAKPPQHRKQLDIAYFNAMKKVYAKYPSDPDIGALYAESLMDLHPWDLYEKKTKKPKKWTPELLTVLEHLMKVNPKHPGAHHFYIHAVEASATPEKGMESARLLLTLVPGSGHLLHMPSHIYINTGDYHLGTLSNIKAIETDSNYITTCHAQGVYPLAYFPHNYHFLAATATLEGSSKLAWTAAKKVKENTAQEIMTQPGWGTLQHYYSIPYYVAIKFAMWDTILSIPMPDKTLIYPRSLLHYARGMAYLGKNNLQEAETELTQLIQLSKDTTLQTVSIWGINTTADLAVIATKVLTAELARKQHKYDKSIALLQHAVQLEDQLNYNEPPDWFFSIRHTLGAVLLEAGKYTEAEKVYREDLQTFRENGWALHGLYTALLRQGKNADAQKMKQRFDKAWQYADFTLTESVPLSMKLDDNAWIAEVLTNQK